MTLNELKHIIFLQGPDMKTNSFNQFAGYIAKTVLSVGILFVTLAANAAQTPDEKATLALLLKIKMLGKHDLTDIKFVSKVLKVRLKLVKRYPNDRKIYQQDRSALNTISYRQFEYTVADGSAPENRWARLKLGSPKGLCFKSALIFPTLKHCGVEQIVPEYWEREGPTWLNEVCDLEYKGEGALQSQVGFSYLKDSDCGGLIGIRQFPKEIQ